MEKRILIVTHSNDLHADIIAQILEAKGARFFRINLDTFPRDFQLFQKFAGGIQSSVVKHIPSQDELDFSEIGAVWLRKEANFEFISDNLNPQEKAYAEQETEHVLFGLLYSLDCYWISHPLAIRGALWKGEQLQRAAKLGFQIPASIISNQPDEVKEFKRDITGDMVFKSMSSSFLAADKVDENSRISSGIATTLITDEHMNSLDAISELPCCFQEYIPKQYELRVTVIGDKVFAAKINSQDDERTKIDFRDFSVDILYEAIELPLEIEKRCREFVHSYKLNFGALDIIVTPDNEYVFLENNPGGQFWFVEQLVPELKMMDTLADCLIKGARC